MYIVRITEIAKTQAPNKHCPGKFVTRRIFEQSVEKLNLNEIIDAINKDNDVIPFDKNFTFSKH